MATPTSRGAAVGERGTTSKPDGAICTSVPPMSDCASPRDLICSDRELSRILRARDFLEARGLGCDRGQLDSLPAEADGAGERRPRLGAEVGARARAKPGPRRASVHLLLRV